jgi:hypothetical protein
MPQTFDPDSPSITPIGTEARVCADIARRQQMGINKYGKTVAGNPLSLREWLQHAYEESLDQAIYLRRAIEEIDNLAKRHPDYPCRADGRCQYAIDSGAEGDGHCPKGKCVMPDTFTPKGE